MIPDETQVGPDVCCDLHRHLHKPCLFLSLPRQRAPSRRSRTLTRSVLGVVIGRHPLVTTGHASSMVARIWKIESLVETDDEADVDRLSYRMEQLACDLPTSGDDHTCRSPWFLITSALDDVEAATWRPELNR